MLTQLLQISALEWFATITGFLCVYLAAKQNSWNWPLSILSVSSYIIIFYDIKLYGDMVLQLYFLGTAVYGWYYWQQHPKDDQNAISSLSRKQWILALASILIATLLIGSFLAHFTDSDVPYIDGFCTSCSFIAQFLMTRKIIENWLIWVFVDLCYIPLYVHKELYLTAFLYLAFTIIAWKGYIDWRKSYRKRAAINL